jgi:hypothetical protein
MFCPECKAEYRAGFTRCADCDVDLVEALPGDEPDGAEPLTVIWACAGQSECVGVCQDLRRADIPYQVDQIPYERTEKMGEKWRYRVLISHDDLERAKKILGIDAPQNTFASSEDEEVVDPSVELADAGVPFSEEHKRREKTYLDPWDPDEATVEIWRQETDDYSAGVERALDANYFHCRCESNGPGSKRIFVRPEDEPFARKIVREILEGRPSE